MLKYIYNVMQVCVFTSILISLCTYEYGKKCTQKYTYNVMYVRMFITMITIRLLTSGPPAGVLNFLTPVCMSVSVCPVH